MTISSGRGVSGRGVSGRGVSGRGHRRQRDRRSLPVLIGCTAALLLLASGYVWLIGAGGSHDAFGGPFELRQDDGRAVTDRSFRGKILLVYFGYTACQDVCPTALTSMAAALDALGADAAQVQPLFITVDPARDTPEAIRRFVQSFTPRLIGLTGTPDALRRVAGEYRISTVVHHSSSAGAGYAVDHSSVIFLVGRDGRAITPLRADQSGADLARAIARYLS